jgi:hypothetical protein
MLSLPPHSSHKLQPLDKTFFGPLKKLYYKGCDNFMLSPKNHGKRITIYDVPSIFNFAYGKCATIEKGVNGFASTGICPFNPEIFSDEDFEPSLLTDNDHTYHAQELTGAGTVDVETEATTSQFAPATGKPPSKKSRRPLSKPKSAFTSRPISKLVGLIRKPTYLSSCITPSQSDPGDQLVSTLPVTMQVVDASIQSDLGDQLVRTSPVATQVAEDSIQSDLGDQLISISVIPPVALVTSTVSRNCQTTVSYRYSVFLNRCLFLKVFNLQCRPSPSME